MPLNHDVHELLLILERAQGGRQEWVHIDALRHLSEQEIEHAVRENWVKQKSFGNNREFKILAAGYSALGDNAELAIKRMRGENIDVLDAPSEPEISVSVYSETLGTDANEAAVAKPARTRRATGHDLLICIEPDCGEHRYQGYPRCESHQKALWRVRQNAKNAHKKSAPVTQPSVKIVEPTFADEDTQPDIVPIVDTPPVSAPALTRLFARALVKSILLVKGS